MFFTSHGCWEAISSLNNVNIKVTSFNLIWKRPCAMWLSSLLPVWRSSLWIFVERRMFIFWLFSKLLPLHRLSMPLQFWQASLGPHAEVSSVAAAPDGLPGVSRSSKWTVPLILYEADKVQRGSSVPELLISYEAHQVVLTEPCVLLRDSRGCFQSNGKLHLSSYTNAHHYENKMMFIVMGFIGICSYKAILCNFSCLAPLEATNGTALSQDKFWGK